MRARLAVLLVLTFAASASMSGAAAVVMSSPPVSTPIAPVQAVAASRALNVPLVMPGATPAASGVAAQTSAGVFVVPNRVDVVGQETPPADEPLLPADELDAVEFPDQAVGGRVVSEPIAGEAIQDVALTWPDHEDGAALAPRVRTLSGGVWSGWTELEVSDEGPDQGTADSRTARAGTELLWVGDVDALQLSVLPSDAAPGAQVALVGADTGRDESTAGSAGLAVTSSAALRIPAAGGEPVSTVPIDIITREQWGAAPQACQPDVAGELVGAAVHHTATRNTYTTVAQAEQDIRNVQAYHIASRGWCDIGYNFLVDKWGNLYEGRAGSLEKPVIGVHAGGFNTGTVGVSMLGDYTSVTPSAATLATVAQVIGVRLGVYGVDPTGTMTYTTGVGENSRFQNETVSLPRVFGHRDVAFTSCPGNLGYPQLAAIRQSAAKVAVGLGPCPDRAGGYWLVGSDGGVFAFCAAGYYGSTGSVALSRPVVTAAATPSGNGYWLVASDGGVFAFGDAQFFGSTGAIALNKPIVAAMATPSGAGYWLVASDGGVFTFGDAAFYGSTGAMQLNKPIVTALATPSGRGYWLIASDGGVFAFGDAQFFGSTGAIRLNKPIVTATATPSGAGYWLIASDGGVFTFGDAQFFGSTGAMVLNRPIVGGVSTTSGKGYWLVASDGGVFTFGDARFLGSVGGIPLADPVVAMVRR